jgi:hypothetical protein
MLYSVLIAFLRKGCDQGIPLNYSSVVWLGYPTFRLMCILTKRTVDMKCLVNHSTLATLHAK